MSENPKKNRLFCFGLGFTAQALAQKLPAQSWSVSGTCREKDKKISSKKLLTVPFDGSKATEEIREFLYQHYQF